MAEETWYHGGSWMAFSSKEKTMIVGKLLITNRLDEDPPEVRVESDTPNNAGFYTRRRSSTLTYDGELQDQFETEVDLAFPENIPA